MTRRSNRAAPAALILTSLYNYATPLLRYEIGDSWKPRRSGVHAVVPCLPYGAWWGAIAGRCAFPMARKYEFTLPSLRPECPICSRPSSFRSLKSRLPV